VITNGQGTIGASKLLVTIPPGPCTVLLANLGTAPTAYVGIGGTGVTAGSGFPVPSGLVSPVTFPGYQGSQGGPLYAVAGAGTAVLAWIISTSTGGTGL
jgi:hypothetical protein